MCRVSLEGKTLKIVRVHNPSGLKAAKPKRSVKTMAARRRRRTTTVRRRSTRARAAVNPRRRRRRSVRRHNPVAIVARRRRRHSAAAPHKRRRRSVRRRNPSGLRIGQILKDMVYGAGGAILTRVGASVAQSFVPGAFGSNPLTGPVLQAGIAVTGVRWVGKKFLGQAQGDIMMLGGLISAGLDLADKYLPNIQGQLTGIIRAPVAVAPGVAAPAQLAGYSDVEDVASFADVEDVNLSEFGGY